MNAVIVDIKKKQAAAMDENGRIVRIHNAGYEIGQKIELHEVKPVRRPQMLRRLGSTAAAFAVVVMIGTGAAYAMPYGTVTLAGSSAVEYTINCFDYVLDVKGANEEGEALLSGMDTRQIYHHQISAAVAATVEHMEQPDATDVSEEEIRVVADTGNDHHTERLQQELEPLIEREPPVLPEEDGNPDRQPSEGDVPQTEAEQLPDQKEGIGSDNIQRDDPAPYGLQNAEPAGQPDAGTPKEADTPEEGFSCPEQNLEHPDEFSTLKPSADCVREMGPYGE